MINVPATRFHPDRACWVASFKDRVRHAYLYRRRLCRQAVILSFPGYWLTKPQPDQACTQCLRELRRDRRFLDQLIKRRPGYEIHLVVLVRDLGMLDAQFDDLLTTALGRTTSRNKRPASRPARRKRSSTR